MRFGVGVLAGVSVATGILAGVPPLGGAAEPPPRGRDGGPSGVVRGQDGVSQHESAEQQRERSNAPARVTTDTAEYCHHLAALYEVVRRANSVDAAGDALAREGAAMCGQGQFRMGVRALRRALVGFQVQP